MNWQQSGFETMPETDGHGDTCGPDAMLAYLHLAKDFPMTISQVDSMRSELINAHLMDLPGLPGMTMQQIHDAFIHYGVTPVKFVDFNASLNFAIFHQDIIDALTNHQLVVVEYANAQALPDNQTGVQYHFITHGGIDSNLGYWTANGDTYTALKSQNAVSPVWYGINDLFAAKPVGYVVLPAIANNEGPQMIIVDKDANGNVTGAHDADNPNVTVGAGFANSLEQNNHLDGEIAVPEENTSGVAYCVIRGAYRAVMTYTPQNNVVAIGGDIVQVVQDLWLANQTVKPTIDNDSAVAAALALVSQDAANVATAVAELQKDVNGLELAQQKDV